MEHTCPPDVGDIDTLMDEARRYGRGVLYQTIGRWRIPLI